MQATVPYPNAILSSSQNAHETGAKKPSHPFAQSSRQLKLWQQDGILGNKRAFSLAQSSTFILQRPPLHSSPCDVDVP